MKAVSKYLALILRHRPDAAGLILDSDGWAAVERVLEAVRGKFGPFDRGDLDRLVSSNDKQRYAYDEGGTRIRANQGHSVEVELGLRPIQPPALLFHGTSRRFLTSILASGLVRGSRHHVHLSGDRETAVKVGGRRAGETIVLEVASGAMAAVGHVFLCSANQVWLTDSVPPEFLAVMEPD